MSIYKQQCEERAGDTIEDPDMDDMAEYSCCFFGVETRKTHWHKCSECVNNVHGYGLGAWIWKECARIVIQW